MADADYGDYIAPPLARGRGQAERTSSHAPSGGAARLASSRQDPHLHPQPVDPRAAQGWGEGQVRRYAGHAPEPQLDPMPPGAPGGGFAGAGLGLRGQKIVNIAGAIGSVALVLSLGWWGYSLAMRDLRGVPVVRALEGPMRITPDDPGGQVVDYQGLAVNDVAADGGAAPPPERLILAPKPVELTLDDAPGLAGSAPAAEAAAPARLATPSSDVPVVDGGTDAAVDAALAEAMGAALGETEAAPEEPVEAVALDANGNPPPEGAITRSPRPHARPQQAAAPVAAVTPDPPQVIDPATLAPGTRLVQFGAFDTEALAAAEWTRIAGRFPELMTGKSMVIQTAESGGRTFYRLRGFGFDSEDDARRFCSALVTEGANCIPVAHR